MDSAFEIKDNIEDVYVGTETILIVEDEEVVRNVAKEILQIYGYTVIAAENGRVAFNQLKSLNHKVDLILTDVVMPEMGGAELAEKSKRIKPKIKLIYFSGHADEIIAKHGIFKKGLPLLKKPFNKNTLLQIVRSELDKV